MSLAALRKSLAEACNGVGGLKGYDYVPGDPVAPCAIVEPEEVDFEATPGVGFRSGSAAGVWEVSVFVLIAPVSDEAADRKRDQFFDQSANDLKAALEAVDPLRINVARADRFGEYPMAGRTFVGCRFVVQVL